MHKQSHWHWLTTLTSGLPGEHVARLIGMVVGSSWRRTRSLSESLDPISRAVAGGHALACVNTTCSTQGSLYCPQKITHRRETRFKLETKQACRAQLPCGGSWGGAEEHSKPLQDSVRQTSPKQSSLCFVRSQAGNHRRRPHVQKQGVLPRVDDTTTRAAVLPSSPPSTWACSARQAAKTSGGGSGKAEARSPELRNDWVWFLLE